MDKRIGKNNVSRTCIFVIGELNDGKSSVIRSLTGCCRGRLWTVRNLANTKDLEAIVIISSIGEQVYPNPATPQNFPTFLEKAVKVPKKNYDLIVCPILASIELNNIRDYLRKALKEGFNVKVGIIEKSRHKKNPTPLHRQRVVDVEKVCRNLGITSIRLDTTNDYHQESDKLRRFYP